MPMGPNALPKGPDVLPVDNTTKRPLSNDLCDPTTEQIIKEMKEIRTTLDWAYIQSLQVKRDKVKEVIEIFKTHLSWSGSSSKLSAANISSKNY
jgi:hypothetical protein